MELYPQHTQRLGVKIQRIWTQLGNLPDKYTLIGGTAIALYCDHRESVDIDLSCRGRADHPRVIRKLLNTEIGRHKTSRGKKTKRLVIKFFDTETRPKIEIHGTDSWIPIEEPKIAENGLRIAAPTDLLARKLLAMADREVARDGQDVQALIDAGTDVEKAVRGLIAQTAIEDVRHLADQLQDDPQTAWPDLRSHDRVLRTIVTLSEGRIRPRPVRRCYEIDEQGNLSIFEDDTPHGKRRKLNEQEQRGYERREAANFPNTSSRERTKD